MSQGNPLLGNITLKDALIYTYQYYPSRFSNMDRDVLKTIIISEKKEFFPDRNVPPQVKFLIKAITYSYPQYSPFDKNKRGNKQRSHKHQYSIVLELESLSMDSRFRLLQGNSAKWNKTPPKYLLKTISKSEKDRIKAQLNLSIRDPKKREIEYKKRIEQRKKSAKYENLSDFNIHTKGINPDFYFRCSPTMASLNCLYGRNYNTEGEVHSMFFLTKHTIRLISVLMDKNILK